MAPQRTRAQAGEALFDHVNQGTTQQAESILSVPVEHFTDVARWQLEIERIFKKLPLVLGWGAEIPNPGDYKTMDVVGMPLLLARDADGQVRVFLNVCTHRGALLAEGERGTRDRFTCGYRGWTFANNGCLIGVPDKAKFGNFDEQARGLLSLPSVERGGMIFAVLSPGAPLDVDSFYGGMLEEIESFGLQDWEYCGSRELASPNWKIAFDGYIENYHFPVAHKNSLAAFVVGGVMTFDAFGPHVRVGAPAAAILSQLESVPRAEWGSFENKSFEFVRAIFPNVTLTVRPELVHLTLIIPGSTAGESRTLLIFLRRTAPEDAQALAHVEEIMDTIRDILLNEDYRLNFGVQKALQSGALKDVVFGRNEVANQFFHKCVDYYLQGASTTQFPSL